MKAIAVGGVAIIAALAIGSPASAYIQSTTRTVTKQVAIAPAQQLEIVGDQLIITDPGTTTVSVNRTIRNPNTFGRWASGVTYTFTSSTKVKCGPEDFTLVSTVNQRMAPGNTSGVHLGTYRYLGDANGDCNNATIVFQMALI